MDHGVEQYSHAYQNFNIRQNLKIKRKEKLYQSMYIQHDDAEIKRQMTEKYNYFDGTLRYN